MPNYIHNKLSEHCLFNKMIISKILKVFAKKGLSITEVQSWYVDLNIDNSRIIVLYSRQIDTAAGKSIERNVAQYISFEELGFDELDFAVSQ